MTQLKVKVAQSCLTLCDPTGCSPPGSSVHGILQARTLEWVAVPFSRESSQPRNWTQVSSIAGEFFTIWATRITGVGSLSLLPGIFQTQELNRGLLHGRRILYQQSYQGTTHLRTHWRNSEKGESHAGWCPRAPQSRWALSAEDRLKGPRKLVLGCSTLICLCGPSWIVFRLGAAGWFVGTCSSPHVTPSICPLPSEKTCGQRGRHQQVWSSTQFRVAIATSFPHNPLPPHQMFILATWSKPSDPVWPRGTLPPFPVQLVQPQPGQQRGGQAQSFGSRRSCRPAFSYHFPSFPRLPHWVVWGWGVRSCDFRNLERTGSNKTQFEYIYYSNWGPERGSRGRIGSKTIFIHSLFLFLATK